MAKIATPATPTPGVGTTLSSSNVSLIIMASRRLPGLASFAILLLLAVAVAADEAFAEEDDDGPALNFSSGEFEAPTDAPDVQADLGGYEYDDEDVFDSRRTEDW